MNVPATLRTIILLCCTCIVAAPRTYASEAQPIYAVNEGRTTAEPTLPIGSPVLAAKEASEKKVTPTESTVLGRCEAEGRLQYEPCMEGRLPTASSVFASTTKPSIPARIPENRRTGTNQKTFTGSRTPTAPT